MDYPLGPPTIILLHPGIDPPICERCSECMATMSLKEIGVCCNCFSDLMCEMLEPILGYKACCEFWSEIDHSHQPALCLALRGTEHTHQD